VNDRFAADWEKRTHIEVAFTGLSKRSIDVRITDNGVGLDSDNFRSFRTYDSPWKARRGGKGVGRLSWLKVFDHAEVNSIYREDGRYFSRKFRLVLDNDHPIEDYERKEIDPAETGTTVRLVSMRSVYAQHVPVTFDTVLRKLVGHFISYLVTPSRPSIIVSSDEQSVDLADFLASREVRLGDETILIDGSPAVQLEHNLLEKSVVEDPWAHKLFFTAHNRNVLEFDIGTALGIKTLIEREGGRYVYAGVVSGDLLDETVNAERTAFDLDDTLIEQIKAAAIKTVREALAPQVERVISRQTELTTSLIKKYPRFAYLVDNPRTFAEQKVPRNFRTAEQIYERLAVYDFREHRDIERKVENLSKSTDDDEAIQTGVDAVLEKLTDQEFSVLADYTVRRKVVLDLLDRRLGYRPDGTMKHEAEEALHSFVLPMRAEAHDVSVEKHNLWIVDDKLTYYEYWASDRALKKILEESESKDRPDVLLFGGRTVFHRPGTDQPIVLIEFKRPVREDYSDDENPFSQIYGYIEEMRGGRVLDRNGAQISEVSESTPFFCYIVADLTPKLRTWLRMAQINVPLPGGGGFYGYNPEYKAFVQILSYKYVLKDARLRNEAFFKQLGI
jgi:hypothetical protein